jgi:hypothetical protein
MPFDPPPCRQKSVTIVTPFPASPTGFRPPRVTVLPPTLVPMEPGEGGGPGRVHIEVVVHLPSPPARRRSSALWWWLLALMFIAVAAHAQPAEWRSYEFGNCTTGSTCIVRATCLAPTPSRL